MRPLRRLGPSLRVGASRQPARGFLPCAKVTHPHLVFLALLANMQSGSHDFTQQGLPSEAEA
eukprot:4507310-Alexandrium_andersonii.AAC.1